MGAFLRKRTQLVCSSSGISIVSIYSGGSGDAVPPRTCYIFASVQVLSHSVISALNLHVIAHRIENSAIDTVRFIKYMDIQLTLRP
ncbi:hypothetical protein AVEN_114091-1 [Araneus ventricosus]|uniref:Uncharacterized protein n=1 Tax=Araneus ventricosus TaxID=182803 RepID=A0A4Y2RTM3_ARAVE|nr:hypothetical protein AVEN_114091-1 [Araneus ventricosus]